jgi:aerobic-type carbon monoxide dehydrogenase small subunit (CoxS/CutS family)
MSGELHQLSVTVNGAVHTTAVEARLSLADFLRADLALTGTHVGCEHGVCGACTVLVDGRPIRACLMLAIQADGCEIATVEGVARGGALHPVQQGFVDCHSFQCGFCAPGIVMATVAFLEETPDPSEEQIREAMSSNLCRCTGYQSIVDGVRRGAELQRAREDWT